MACAVILVLAGQAQAAFGDLDSTFDFDGKQTTTFGQSNDFGSGVAVQADGKVVVAGSSSQGNFTSGDFALARYNTDGTLDTSFSGDGKQTSDFSGGADDAGEAVAVQADGKVVVAGSSGGAFAVARYNADGTLDSSFSGDGKQTTDFGNDSDRGGGVAVQADGKIVVAGTSDTFQKPEDFALARYNADGTLDSSFSGDGKQTTDFPAETYDVGAAVALQPEGRIVVAGFTGSNSANEDFALARYNADGTLDNSFSGDGIQTTNFANADHGNGVALQADGKIVVAGFAGNSTSADFALARYNADGTLDTSFSGDGKQTTDFPGEDDEGEAVALQADGKIVVAGSSYQGAPADSDFALARYNIDGTLDTSFSGDGKQTTAFSQGYDAGSAVALQADGKVVVAGFSYQGAVDSDFALARYQGDSGPAPQPQPQPQPQPDSQPQPQPNAGSPQTGPQPTSCGLNPAAYPGCNQPTVAPFKPGGIVLTTDGYWKRLEENFLIGSELFAGCAGVALLKAAVPVVLVCTADAGLLAGAAGVVALGRRVGGWFASARYRPLVRPVTPRIPLRASSRTTNPLGGPRSHKVAAK